jgi:hypothetical protein
MIIANEKYYYKTGSAFLKAQLIQVETELGTVLLVSGKFSVQQVLVWIL